MEGSEYGSVTKGEQTIEERRLFATVSPIPAVFYYGKHSKQIQGLYFSKLNLKTCCNAFYIFALSSFKLV